MRKWNLPAMLYNDDSEYEYKFEITSGEESITLFDSNLFKDRVLYKYTSFCITSPSFFDPVSGQQIEVCTDITVAISMLHNLFDQWKVDREHAFTKMFEAMIAEFNPLWNVDGVEGLVTKTTHTGTNVNAKTGKDSLQASGSDVDRLSGSDTSTLSGSDTVKHDVTKDDVIRTGSEALSRAGNDTDTTTVATFDSGDNLSPERAVRTDYASTDTTTYNSVKDAHTLDSQDRTTYGKSDQMVYGKVDTTQYGRKDETTYNSSNTETRNLVDEYLEMKIRQGNIGVTKSTDLIESQLRLRDSWDHLIDYFIADFIRQYCIL